MQVPFYKYHGTGNDFIIIDQRQTQYLFSDHRVEIQNLCDRHFGIGADGLILLENSEHYDFKMIYFNSDGRQSTMCGNGGRCIVHLANSLGIFTRECSFEAIDGQHKGIVGDNNVVHLHMQDVTEIAKDGTAFVLDTGSPHYVQFGEDVLLLDLIAEARQIRYNENYKSKGINVNFVQKRGDHLLLRTYERGVENETLSCGTGVTATAIAASVEIEAKQESYHWQVETRGGTLEVRYQLDKDGRYSDIWLVGPATKVFEGSINLFL